MALLNRGTPGSLVSPDGTLHIALMRSCSAWPSGVWIDGDRRTAPDGSSFAWQHWSHTFEYALAAGAGDWRDARFGVAGQDYNHELLACQTGLHPGPHAAAASLCAADLPVMVSVLKPRGNPLAAGRAGAPRREDGITARLRDLGGRAVTAARLSLFTPITAAHPISLVEDTGPAAAAGGPALPVRAGQAEVGVPPGGTVTLGLSVPPAAGTRPPAAAPAPPEPAQPVFTRYWLHGKGPAPAGNLPVAVHLSPGRVWLPGGAAGPDAATVRLTVACGPEPAAGIVELDIPPGLAATPAGPLRYDLPALGHAHWDLAVRGTAGAAAGHYFLAARVRDGLGQVLEDAAGRDAGRAAGGRARPVPGRAAACPGGRGAGHRGRGGGHRAHASRPGPARDGGGTRGPAGQPGRLAGPGRGAADLAVRQLGGGASLDARFFGLPRKRSNSPLSCRGTDYYPARHAVVDNGQTDVFRSTSLHHQRSRAHLRMNEPAR